MMSHQARRTGSDAGRICRLSALALAVAALTSTAASAADKNLILDVSNGTGATTKTIPLKPGTNVQINSQGNLTATCELNQGNCPGIGEATGTAPTITFPNVELTQGSLTKTLTWSSNGVACYGVSPTSGVTNWNNGLLASLGNTSQQTGGLQLNGLASGNNIAQTYPFQIRCYSLTGGVGTGNATVTVNPSTTPPDTEYCEAYKATLSPANLAKFNNYYAGNRGMQRHKTNQVYTSFSTFTGMTLGVGSGSAPNGLPTNLDADQYLALDFKMTTAGSGRFTINLGGFALVGQTHDIVATISPCEGDFRPSSEMPAGDRFARPICRMVSYSRDGLLQGRMAGTGTSGYCDTPVDTTLYVNVSARNLYTAGVAYPLAQSTIPNDECTISRCGLEAGITPQ